MPEVVVGVDGSEASARALRVAAHEAEVLGDDLRVLHSWAITSYTGVVQGYGSELVPPEYEDHSEWARVPVEDLVEDVARGSAVPVVTDVHPGDPGTDLVRASRLADLVVLGSRRHGRLASAVLGSATRYVLHRARCPVMVVPARPGPTGPWQHVVAALDGSGTALAWAEAQARAHGCELVVLPAGSGRGAAARLLAATGPDDLLVVGSRDRGRLARLLHRSLAEQCASTTRGAVAVLPAGRAPVTMGRGGEGTPG